MSLRRIGIVLAVLTVTHAHAEFGILTAGDNYCKAEVRAGPYGSGNPDQLSPLTSGRVSQGDEFRQGEGVRICARREGTPGNCSSPVSPNWLCVSPTAGISVGQAVKNTF